MASLALGHLHPSTITLPTYLDEQVTIHCSDNVCFLGLFIDRKFSRHGHVKITAIRAGETVKVFQLQVDSARGLDQGN
jgi:hypothetical protein